MLFRSCVCYAFVLNAIVSIIINSGEKLYRCFIDYEKAITI